MVSKFDDIVSKMDKLMFQVEQTDIASDKKMQHMTTRFLDLRKDWE